MVECPCGIFLNGTVQIIRRDDEAGLLITRTLFPSPDQTALCELVEYENVSGKPLPLPAEEKMAEASVCSMQKFSKP